MSNLLNTLPIEDFLNKARIAIKSNQKNVTLSIKAVSYTHLTLPTILRV